MIGYKEPLNFLGKNGKIKILFFLVFIRFLSNGQENRISPLPYITRYSEEAVQQMVNYKIPASVILAQAIFESNSGNSALAIRSNNHFGIKCHTVWEGDTIVKTDDTLNECFRKYQCIEDSYMDHSLFLKSRPRYAQLFKLPLNDYKNWCLGLKASGYATYASYAQDLIKIIEDHKLYMLDGAEQLSAIDHSLTGREILMENTFCLKYATLNDFAKSEILFIEEKEALIQNLDLIINAEEIVDIAENYKYCKPGLSDGAHDVQ